MTLLGQEKAEGHDAILGHEAVVNSLHVILHFVGSREFLAAHRTGENFPLVAFVIEEGVPLEAVLVLEGLLNVNFGALRALVDALGYRSVAKKIKAPHRHLG